MLITLNNSTLILPTSYCSKAGVRSIAEQYLSTSKTYARITKSIDEKYHLVTTHEHSFHNLKTVLKVISYCTVILPLLAKIIKLSIKDNRSTNKYYADCSSVFYNFNMLKSADIHELAALHKLHPNLLTEGHPFAEACLQNNKDMITHLFNLGGKELLNQTDKEGDTVFTAACINCSYTMISFIFNLGGIDLLKQVNRHNNRTVLVDAVKENRSWHEISKINQATQTFLFQTVSNADLFTIKELNPSIYNNIINTPSFRLNPNYSKHTTSYSSNSSTKSSNSKNFHISEQTFEDTLKVLFDGKKLVKTKKAITKAYKLACARHHPDKNTNQEKEALPKFLAIQAANQQIQKSDCWKSLPEE